MTFAKFELMARSKPIDQASEIPFDFRNENDISFYFITIKSRLHFDFQTIPNFHISFRKNIYFTFPTEKRKPILFILLFYLRTYVLFHKGCPLLPSLCHCTL